MITHRQWLREKKNRIGCLKEQHWREGWFLFGIVPLYTRTVKRTYFG